MPPKKKLKPDKGQLSVFQFSKQMKEKQRTSRPTGDTSSSGDLHTPPQPSLVIDISSSPPGTTSSLSSTPPLPGPSSDVNNKRIILLHLKVGA